MAFRAVHVVTGGVLVVVEIGFVKNEKFGFGAEVDGVRDAGGF
jgi:hypothetical protein